MKRSVTVHLRVVFAAALLVLVALLAGGCSAMTPGNVKAVQPVSSAPRAGNAYLLRGFIGIFSTGIDNLGKEINAQGVRAMIFQDDQWQALAENIRKKYRGVPNPEPLILIGHSYGADDVVRIARELNKDNVKVDLLLTLDPVTPPTIPPNVQYCFNIYQSNGVWDTLPWLRGVAVEGEKGAPTRIVNANIRKERQDLLEPGLDHFNIEKKESIHGEIVRQVLGACPPRAEWAARNGSPSVEPPAVPAAVRTPAANTAVNPSAPARAAPIRAMSSGGTSPRVAGGQGN